MREPTHGVVGIDALFLDHTAVGRAVDIAGGFLGVTADTDVETAGALGDQRDEVEERDLNERPAVLVSNIAS